MRRRNTASGAARLLAVGFVTGFTLTAWAPSAAAAPEAHVCRFAPQLCEKPGQPPPGDDSGGSSSGGSTVPELGLAGLGGGLVLLAGGLASMAGRRRRALAPT